MSEEAEVEVADTPEYSVQDMLDAIHSQNLVTARANFDAVIQQKIDTALEAEKVSIANAVYNGLEAEESDEEEAAEVEAHDSLLCLAVRHGLFYAAAGAGVDARTTFMELSGARRRRSDGVWVPRVDDVRGSDKLLTRGSAVRFALWMTGARNAAAEPMANAESINS